MLDLKPMGITNLALTMKITDGQAKTIKNRIDSRVAILCSGKSNAYLSIVLRKEIYSHVWKTLKDHFCVTDYHDICRKNYSESLKYINSIVLPEDLLKEVQALNSH